MARTAAPVVPGTDPRSGSPVTQQAPDDAADLTGDDTEQLPPGLANLQAQMAEMLERGRAQDAEIAALRRQLSRTATAQPPEPVKHPTMAEVLESEPKTPVLTTEGWYVPAALPGAASKGI